MKILATICVLAVGVSAQVGQSGIISPEGVNTQFSPEFASNIILIGPSGILTKTGENRQLTAGEAALHVASHPFPTPVPVYVQRPTTGASGSVYPDGRNVQFTHAQADNVVLRGPSGIVMKDGRNIQFDEEHQYSRKKRDVKGPSGWVLKDGTQIQFKEPGVELLLDGPSGYVFSDGNLVQKNRPKSVKLEGPSGMLLEDGTQVQFDKPGVVVLLEGPSGYVLSDGKLIQKST